MQQIVEEFANVRGSSRAGEPLPDAHHAHLGRMYLHTTNPGPQDIIDDMRNRVTDLIFHPPDSVEGLDRLAEAADALSPTSRQWAQGGMMSSPLSKNRLYDHHATTSSPAKKNYDLDQVYMLFVKKYTGYLKQLMRDEMEHQERKHKEEINSITEKSQTHVGGLYNGLVVNFDTSF